MYEVNQTVFIKTQGNYSRHRGQEILTGRIVKVGRKYVTVKFKGYDQQFHLENGEQKTEYCRDFQLYANKQDLEDELERGQLKKNLLNLARRTFSLDQLRRINSILKEVNV